MHVRQSAFGLFATLLLAAGAAPMTGCGGDDSTNNDGTTGDNGGNGGLNGNNGIADSIGSVRIGMAISPDMMSLGYEAATTVFAAFYSEPQVGDFTGSVATGCTTSTGDSTTNTGNTDTTPPTYVSAGDVTITVGDKTATQTWDGSLYVGSTQTSKWFTGGEDISVEAAGDTVPAFSGDFKAPHVFTFTSDLTTMKTGSDYSLKWTNGAASEQIMFTLTNPSRKTATVCIFDSGKGTGTIPGKELTALGTGDAILAAFVSSATRVTVGANKVDLNASATYMDKVTIN